MRSVTSRRRNAKNSARNLLAQGTQALQSNNVPGAVRYYEAAHKADPSNVNANVARTLIGDQPRGTSENLGELRKQIEKSSEWKWNADWYRIVNAQAGASLNKIAEVTNREWFDPLRPPDPDVAFWGRINLIAQSTTAERIESLLDKTRSYVDQILEAAQEVDAATPAATPRYPRWFLTWLKRRALARWAMRMFVHHEVRPALAILDDSVELVRKQLAALLSDQQHLLANDSQFVRVLREVTERVPAEASYRVNYNRACFFSRAAIPVDVDIANANVDRSLACLRIALTNSDGYVAAWLAEYARRDPALHPVRQLQPEQFEAVRTRGGARLAQT